MAGSLSARYAVGAQEPALPQREPKKISPSYLRNLVMWYLEQHDAPVAHVRRLLMQRVHRAVAFHDQDPAWCAAQVDELLEDLVKNDLLDDHRYAVAKCRALQERGQSQAKIRATLRSKGVSASIIDDVLQASRTEDTDPERLSAIRYARRRRFGPWRRPDSSEDARRKELASMARAGFSYDLSRRILDADDAFALEDELPRGW